MTERAYKPKYQLWWEEDFWSDRRVISMPPQARHYYRALLQAAFFCKTRPYLPIDDEELTILADAISSESWLEQKAVVLRMFDEVTIDGDKYWGHVRLMQDWEKLKEERQKFSEWGKKSGEARRAKSNGGSGSVEQSMNNMNCELRSVNVNCEEMNNDINEIIDPIDVVGHRSLTDSETPKTSDNPTSSLDSEAQRLVETLHFLLSQRKDQVAIPDNYESLWFRDFRSVVELYAYAELELVVIYSQLPRNQKYYKRAASIVKNIDSLCDQAMEDGNRDACKILWKQANEGRFPPPKKEKATA